VAGDFDEVAVELALVPLGEDGVQLVGGEAEAALEQVVGFADELHVAVLDAVVDHLDVVACAVFADPVAAGVPSSTLAAMDWKMSLTCGHAAGLPPGMMEGPKRAPSSPPETPVPMKRMPFSARALVRRLESVKSELPPSMMMSPASRWAGCGRSSGRRCRRP
jgi:hypothetical protein